MQSAAGATGNDQEIKQFLAKHDIETIVIGGCDVNGVFRGKRIPSWRFADNPGGAMHFADVMCVMDLEDEIIPRQHGHDGWWPSWDAGFGDLEAKPDLSTLRLLPWVNRTALVLCDYNDVHGQVLSPLPRNVLRRVESLVESAGFRPRMAHEFEFTVLGETPESLEEKDFRNPRPLAARPSTYGTELAGRYEPLVAEFRSAIEGLGIPIEASNAESGPGQFELNMSPASALVAADNAFLFKYAVRSIALSAGHVATFMAKLAPGGFGSSCHVHQSLLDHSGTNVFYDPDDPDQLSTTARQYLAGMVATMREFTAVFAPTINSYKRFEAEAAVGCTVTWSIQSKSVGIRVVPEGATGCRIEHRTPGADANPYLILAAMLAGGLWGIENDLDPGKPYVGNSYADPNAEWVPRTLHDAVSAFEQSEVANKYLGEDAVSYFAGTRRWEIEQFNKTVTNWELRRYLTTI
jgi:glutamine synthetase